MLEKPPTNRTIAENKTALKKGSFIEDLSLCVAKNVRDAVSKTRRLVRKAIPAIMVPAAVVIAGSQSNCTLNAMGEGVDNKSDAFVVGDGNNPETQSDAGSEDVSSDMQIWPDQDNPEADGGDGGDVGIDVKDAGKDADSMPDVDGGDVVFEDVVQENDGQAADAPVDVTYDVPPGVGAVAWSDDMDGYTVMHISGANPQPNSSSPNLAVCQQKPFTSNNVQTNDYIELFVKENTPNDGGACVVDGGTGLDCENIAASLFTPINIVPVFVEGRCAKYAFDCPGWADIIPEINDSSGYITLAPMIGGGVWKYVVPQSCTAKVYKLHF